MFFCEPLPYTLQQQSLIKIETSLSKLQLNVVIHPNSISPSLTPSTKSQDHRRCRPTTDPPLHQGAEQVPQLQPHPVQLQLVCRLQLAGRGRHQGVAQQELELADHTGSVLATARLEAAFYLVEDRL